MEYRRFIIIAALAVVTYSLVMQWKHDYHDTGNSQATENTVESIEPFGESDSSFSNQSNIESSDSIVTGQNKQINSDIPSADVEEEEVLIKEVPIKNFNAITVRTDVVEYIINPVGGDFYGINLLEYLNELDNPNVPFSLLENNSNRTYIAQSGLIGRDGPDASKQGRPHYQAEKNSFIPRKNFSPLPVQHCPGKQSPSQANSQDPQIFCYAMKRLLNKNNNHHIYSTGC